MVQVLSWKKTGFCRNCRIREKDLSVIARSLKNGVTVDCVRNDGLAVATAEEL